MSNRNRGHAVWIWLMAVAWCGGLLHAAEPLRVAGAVSLQEALTGIAADFEKQQGGKVEPAFGSSGQLVAQIRNGAPYDVFISAAREQVDELVKAKLADAATQRVIAGNTLVLIVPAGAAKGPQRFEDLTGAGIAHVSIGEPTTVPAGKYAAQVLDHLKLTESLKDRLVYGKSVRQVLDYVERGEVDAGIVYATDARVAADKVRAVATADPSWHAPIEYVAVVVAVTRQADAARKFLEFLGGDSAQSLLRKRGFLLPVDRPAAAPAGHVPVPSGSPHP